MSDLPIADSHNDLLMAVRYLESADTAIRSVASGSRS